MEVLYTSTRNHNVHVRSSEAILKGLSADGGLFVPECIPSFDAGISKLGELDYRETAFEVMKLFLTDFTEEELKDCIAKAYDEKFDCPETAPLKNASGRYYLELFHGKTIAFKDMALSILPHLMSTAARKNKIEDEIVILTATSGDTGKAALAGFADVPGIKIVVYYPKHGVSRIQELQMVTQAGDNTCVIGIEGNFDQAQTGVKKMFSDPELAACLKERGYRFSSANSLNIGRLVPQVVYYFYAYGQLLKSKAINAGEAVNFTVPTGNFGNILAAWYAKQMGLPVGTLICASNENKVLFDFFSTGKYDRNRPFILTTSPSMDILISSNLERLIYHASGDDDKAAAACMKSLSEKGNYKISDETAGKLSMFYAGYADMNQTAEEIGRVYDESGYVLDPHTAVASFVCSRYEEESGDKNVNVVVSTASPFKFPESVLKALGKDISGLDEFALEEELCGISSVPIPRAVEELKSAPVRHKRTVAPEAMESALKDFLFS